MKIKLLCLCLCIFAFSACNKHEVGSQDTSTQSTVKLNNLHINPDVGMHGVIRGQPFKASKANLENGILKIREGDEFFEDRSISIFTFSEDTLENKTLTYTLEDTKNFGQPHIHLAVRLGDKDVPDSRATMKDYSMTLKFGEYSEFGVPIDLDFIFDGDERTEIHGQYFALFENIKLTDSDIDLTYDSFDTLKYVGTKYIADKYEITDIGDSFGSSYMSYTEEPFPKSGFTGFEVNSSVEAKIIKLQFFKNASGWSVVNELQPKQIHEAHISWDIPTGNARTERKRALQLLAAETLEKHIGTLDNIENIRASTVNCRLVDKYMKATCFTAYQLKVGEDKECKKLNWLMTLTDNGWVIDKEIAPNLRIDYKTGELKQASSLSCNS